MVADAAVNQPMIRQPAPDGAAGASGIGSRSLSKIVSENLLEAAEQGFPCS